MFSNKHSIENNIWDCWICEQMMFA